MVTAATVSSLRVLRMRPAGRSGSSSASPRTSGIMPTPVSNPESPSASSGNTTTAAASMENGPPWLAKRADCQSARTLGSAKIS